MAIFWAIINLINNLFSAYKAAQDAWAAERAAQAEIKRQTREKAIDEAKNAKTPEDAFAAQEKIVDSKPTNP